MLDDLVGVITTLQQRIRDHGPALRENETRTRMALIDPLLAALGWNVSDPAVVTPEYNVSGRWADYALLGTDGKPAATLEAKKLGESLASHRMQMLNYSNAAGITYAGLTDGNHWELYEVFAPKPLEERRVLQLSTVDTPAHQCALQLLLLWRPNLASGQPTPASEPILTAVPETKPPTIQVSEPVQSGWVALSKYNLPGGTPAPTSIRFSDGDERPISQWYEVLTHTVEWLHLKGWLTADNVPVRSNPVRYAVNIEPIHPNGDPFVNAITVNGTPFIVSINLNAQQVRRRTTVVLQHCGVDPATVQLQVEE